MNISKKMEKAINDQINAELYSAYLYLSMSAFCEDNNLPGAAYWFKLQTKEEVEHAIKFYNYVFERGGMVELEKIDKPEKTWKDIEDVFKNAYEHEQYVTKRIHDLVDLAIEEKDHATQSFLKWFVDEQVEEENSTSSIYEKIKMVKDFKGGLFMIDRELGQREEEEED